MAESIRIIGIDPGSRITGYGIIDSDGSTTRHVASGCINVAGQSFAARLRAIFVRVGELVEEFSPGELAIEKVFVHKNADSALKLGQARAAAICATYAAELAVHEYAAREVKQAVVGGGAADKQQVQHMVRAILALDSEPASDQADALAVAVCHAHSVRLNLGVDWRATGRRRSGRSSSWRKFAG